MSANNDTINADPENLAQDDLVELYHKLAGSYRKVKEDNDELKQQLHLASQNLRIFTNSQNDLQNELDNINSVHREEIEEIEKKSSSTIETLKLAKQELEVDKAHLEGKIEDLNNELETRQKECDELRESIVVQKPKPRISDSFSINLEVEIESLQRMLKDLQVKLQESDEKSHGKDELIEQLTEKIMCLEDNLDSKKNELEEKNEAMESLQEKVHELTVELAVLKSAPEDANRKGNSLFAELDDQRQILKRLLQDERDHYTAIKKAINAKEIEIRRLKRENLNVKTEIQTCSGLLRRGEQIAIQTLTTQVTQLQVDNKRLDKMLVETEKKLIDLANEQNLGWIESLMSSGSFENRDLKDKLMKAMMEKASLADNLNKVMRDLAKSRLDCVKIKILLGRIVDTNLIKINVSDHYDIGVDAEVLENLKFEELEKVEEVKEPQGMFDDGALNESTISLLGGRDRLGSALPIRSPQADPESPVKLNQTSVKFEEKENSKKNNHSHQTPLKLNIPTSNSNRTIQAKVEKISPPKPLRSIQPDLVPKEESKNVKFNDVVQAKVIDSNPEELEESRQARKRNAIVVRRIALPSKTSNENS